MQDAQTDADQASQPDAIEIDYPFGSSAELESELGRALQDDQFILHLQPIVNLSSWSIQGIELLLRWNHPRQGIIPPDIFIPVLEQTGLIVAVGQWMLGEACRLNRRWQDDGLAAAPMTIKISGPQLASAGFADTVFGILEDARLSPEYLVLELTENDLFTRTSANIRLCNQVRDKGVRLALGYAGNGYTSIEDISELPIDIIKLEKELIHHIANHRDQRAIMAAILGFAHQNRLEVVAEGVETAEQLLFLKAMHCTSARGFLLAHPQSVEKFTELYRSAPRYEYLIDKISRQWRST